MAASVTPTLVGAEEVFTPLDEPVDLTVFCYVVVHYGVGQGGVHGSGGGVAFFQITNNVDTFPQTGSGPNGFRRDLPGRSLPVHPRCSGWRRDYDVAGRSPEYARGGRALSEELVLEELARKASVLAKLESKWPFLWDGHFVFSKGSWQASLFVLKLRID